MATESEGRVMKAAVWRFFFALLFCSNAFGVTLLLGGSQFTAQDDGVWYQKAFPYELKMTSPSVGLRYDTKRYGAWGYSAGYQYLGYVSSYAIATGIDGRVPGDRGYNPETQKCNGECGYLSHWYGKGDVQGLYSSAVRWFGNWAIEAGLYLYRPTWNMTIPDWVGEDRNATPKEVKTSLDNRWQLGPMLGLRYQIDKWSLNLSTWQTQSQGECCSLYHNLTTNFSLGYTF